MRYKALKNKEKNVIEIMETIMNMKNDNPIANLLRSESYNMNGDIEFKKAYIGYKFNKMIDKNDAYNNGKKKKDIIHDRIEEILNNINDDADRSILIALAYLPDRDDLNNCSYAMRRLQDIIGLCEDHDIYEKYRNILYGMVRYYTGQDSDIDSFMLQDHSQPAPF